MERSVSIDRSRSTGGFLVAPFGTFKSYGGLVAVNPVREVLATASDAELGKTILDLLELSGPIPVHIRDARTHLDATADEQTREIRSRHGLDSQGMTEAVYRRKFLSATVSFRDGQKSLLVMTAPENAQVRVRFEDGAEGLGQAVRKLMSEEPRAAQKAGSGKRSRGRRDR